MSARRTGQPSKAAKTSGPVLPVRKGVLAKGRLAKVGALETPARLLVTSARLDGDGVSGALEGPAGTGLALVLGGSVLATAKSGADGAFRFPLGRHAIGARISRATLDVLATESGLSLLRGPIDFVGDPAMQWRGWRCSKGVISGQFRFAGAARGEVVLVQSFLDGGLFFQAFATAGADGAFSFSGPVRAVLAAGQFATIRPCVAGVELDQPISLTSEEIGFLGHLDTSADAEAHGWVIDLSDRTRRIAVEVRLNGETSAVAVAEGYRPDLEEYEISDGHSSFVQPFGSLVDRRNDTQVRAFIAGTETELIGSPYILPAMTPVQGYFDVVEGPFAGGWAVNMFDPGTPLAVEAVCEGEVVGAGLANLYRGDVEKVGLPTPWCGFRFLLDRPLVSLFDKDITLRVAGTDLVLAGSPRQISQNSNIVRFLTRAASLPAPTLHRLVRQATHRTAGTPISIIMPVYNTKRQWLMEALNSVLNQWSANWELIIVDDGSTSPHVRQILDQAEQHDRRIRVMRAPGNMGIARATNFGLRAARGAFVAFMDHDDVIEPDAVYKLALAAQETGADLIYSDEAITTDDINSVIEVRARPAFSHDYYMSHPYFVHMIAVRTSLAQTLGGWDETLAISADVDFVLRAIEGSAAVAHVPSVLYRWRTHSESAGHAKQEQVNDATKAALTRHLERLGRSATVADGMRYNEYRINWPDDGGEVLIVIPTRNRVDLLKACIDSIEKTSEAANYRIVVIDHQSTDKKTLRYLTQIAGRHTVMPYSGVFNYAKMNNLAVKTHAGRAKYVLFLNNDVEAREDGWLPRMRSLAARPDVGAVGPLLLYGDDRIQHAGVLVGFSGAADHAFKFQDAYLSKGSRHPGYNCNLTTVRDYSAVTAACVMIRMDVFKKVRGFDEKFVVGFNDTDLCLRIVDAGFRVLYDGFSVLYHHESATRTESKTVDHPEDDARLRTRWKRFFTVGDPFYNPMLAPKGTDHTLRQDAGCKGRMGARVVRRVMAHAEKTSSARGISKSLA